MPVAPGAIYIGLMVMMTVAIQMQDIMGKDTTERLISIVDKKEKR